MAEGIIIKEHFYMEKQKVFQMKLAKVYPLLVRKAERKNRTKQEVDEIIFRLAGYDEAGPDKLVDELTKGRAMDKILRA